MHRSHENEMTGAQKIHEYEMTGAQKKKIDTYKMTGAQKKIDAYELRIHRRKLMRTS